VSTTLKHVSLWSLFTVAHAALTVLFFLLYMDYAMKVDHGLVTPTLMGTVLQYLKSIVFLPLLLPILRWHADLAVGPLGYFLVLLNSSLWTWAGWWLWRVMRRRSAGMRRQESRERESHEAKTGPA
jgi:hypothetical protein